MNKTYKTKVAEAGSAEPVIVQADKSSDKSPEQILLCVQECNVPGAGTWKVGDVIRDPAIISKISGSPCFKTPQEVK